MLIPETAEASARLTITHRKLTDLTSELNEACAQMNSSSEARQRRPNLQKHREAFKKFETATDGIAPTVKKLHQQVESHHLPGSEPS